MTILVALAPSPPSGLLKPSPSWLPSCPLQFIQLHFTRVIFCQICSHHCLSSKIINGSLWPTTPIWHIFVWCSMTYLHPYPNSFFICSNSISACQYNHLPGSETSCLFPPPILCSTLLKYFPLSPCPPNHIHFFQAQVNFVSVHRTLMNLFPQNTNQV